MLRRIQEEQGVTTHKTSWLTYSPSTSEAEKEDFPQVQSQPGLRSKFQISPGNRMRPCLKSQPTHKDKKEKGYRPEGSRCDGYDQRVCSGCVKKCSDFEDTCFEYGFEA